MNPYLLDLRERVEAACQAGSQQTAVAEKFSVSLSLDGPALAQLSACLRQTPDATSDGLQAAMTVSGAVNGDVFAAYLAQVLGPPLVPSDVVVLDKLPAHEVAGLAEIVAVRGARLPYLLPYSPDFNPIELAFSKLKTGCARPRPAPARHWKPPSTRQLSG